MLYIVEWRPGVSLHYSSSEHAVAPFKWLRITEEETSLLAKVQLQLLPFVFQQNTFKLVLLKELKATAAQLERPRSSEDATSVDGLLRA